jgi:hypothetical protein
LASKRLIGSARSASSQKYISREYLLIVQPTLSHFAHGKRQSAASNLVKRASPKTCGEYDPSVFSDGIEQQVHQKEMTKMVDREGLFESIFAIRNGAMELCSRVTQQRCQWFELAF